MQLDFDRTIIDKQKQKEIESFIYDSDRLYDLILKLKEWRAVRKLSIEGQRAGLLGNLFEEVTEFLRADNDQDRIDALCDMAIFSFNSFDFDENTILYQPNMLGISFGDVIYCYQHLFLSSIGREQKFGDKRLVTISLSHIFALMYLNGYDPFKCVLEAIKEISSRSGEFDTKINKFVKHKGAYCIEDLQKEYPNTYVYDCGDKFAVNHANELVYFIKWYKADYSKCKLDLSK